MADTSLGTPTDVPLSAPSVFTHPPVRQHRDARGGSAVVDALAGDITLCSHSRTFSIQNFPKASVMSATGLLATSVPQFLDYQLCAASCLLQVAFILINAARLSTVIAI